MKISSPDLNLFDVKPNKIFGQDCFLVYPKRINVEWNDDNKIFRSSLWSSSWKPLSLSWKKFTNISEKPEFEKFDLDGPIDYIQKLDGSAGILSKINKNICFRTRGTIDARQLTNGYEIDNLINQYPLLFDNDIINSENFTILTEWTTPNNVICLKESEEPKLWLTGIVKHEDYSYFKQNELDNLAKQWKIARPKRYSFKNFDEAVVFSERQTDIEGLVLYFNDGQILKKCKSSFYLKLHRFKSNANLETVVDLFCEYGFPNYIQFKEKLTETFDAECFELVSSFASRVCDVYKEVLVIKSAMKDFADSARQLPRKDAAIKILSSYGQTNRASFVFQLLDGKEFGRESIKKLLWQVLKT